MSIPNLIHFWVGKQAFRKSINHNGHGGHFKKDTRFIGIGIGGLIERTLESRESVHLADIEGAVFAQSVRFEGLKVCELARSTTGNCAAIQIVRIQQKAIECHRLRIVHSP